MVAMLERNVKMPRWHKTPRTFGNSAPGVSPLSFNAIYDREHGGSFRYSGTPGSRGSFTRYTRRFELSPYVRSPINCSVRPIDTNLHHILWFRRDLASAKYTSPPASSGLPRTLLAYSNPFLETRFSSFNPYQRSLAYTNWKTITAPDGTRRNAKVMDFGAMMGGNIKGRIAVLKWRGDMAWKP